MCSIEDKRYHLGLDIGSVSDKVSLIDDDKNILITRYRRHHGKPIELIVDLLDEVFNEYDESRVRTVSVTGSNLVADLLNATFVNEIIAQTEATVYLHPEVNSIIEIGGEDSKLILLTEPDIGNKKMIEDFSTNAICAAGTGSFLDQQASRLGVDIDREFGELSLKSEHPPRIAGRCSVFAKTDMIHLQQEATPDYDIIAGLCFAMARNFKSTIGKGVDIKKVISFQGGTAANVGMIRAFREVLNLKDGEMIIPDNFNVMGAIGASFYHLNEVGEENYIGYKTLREYLGRERELGEGLKPLTFREESYIFGEVNKDFDKTEKIDAYLGIDVGSISTNLVVINEDCEVLAKRYLMTAGRPIEAVRKGLSEIGEEIGDSVNIRGVGTTGSGRYLTGDFVGADVVRNEITAHATGASFYDPTVDTVFEIGGQDSKYISLENGVIVDFDMNKVCAAGTGSFLEEQAEKLDINIKEEFAELALSAESPRDLGERCTVFMETSLVKEQSKGAETPDLLAGLAYSIVHNYLNRVVQDKRVGDNIFFQGGTAFNKAVVAAFEEVTGKEITVPPHNEVLGAIGMAIVARDENISESTFRGFDLWKRDYELSSFECTDCSNNCEIRKVTIEGEEPLYYGSRCGKYEMKDKKVDHKYPDFFKKRERMLHNIYPHSVEAGEEKGVVGIPRMLWYHELYPFWKALFTELGYRIVRSRPTNKEIIHNGVEAVVTDTCFPVKVAHGHTIDLLKRKKDEIDFLLLPAHISMWGGNSPTEKAFVCPYVQSIPYVLDTALDISEQGVDILQPSIFFHRGKKQVYKELKKLTKKLGVSRWKLKKALNVAMEYQDKFYNTLEELGNEALEMLEPDDRAIVIVSRPYNGCDKGVSLDLPKKLRDLGVMPIPMDLLPLADVELSHEWDNMYWKYGQRILSAVEFIRDDDRLYPLYLTNFGCGPDSFITKFFGHRMADKPYLQIEVDEHSADVGAITRCEAFLDSIENVELRDKYFIDEVPVVSLSKNERKKTIWIPYMCDQAFALKAAFIANDIPAEVIPEPDKESVYWGRKFTTGKECYPCIVTTGDMVKLLKNPDFDKEHAIFFMGSGSGPCRFGQYNMLQRLVLKELGLEDIPIYSPNQGESLYDDLDIAGTEFTRKAWWGIVAIDHLEKVLLQLRPYEVNEGETHRIYWKYVNRLQDLIIEGGDVDDIADLMETAVEEFETIELENFGEKPRIGIVGEIYVRSNDFSNDYIIEEIESLGGEVWQPPVSEWFLYTNWTRMRDSVWRRDWRNWIKNYLTDRVQKRDEHKIGHPFEDILVNYPEPEIEETVEDGSEYIGTAFEGEAVLSIGKAIDFKSKGLHGVVNVMPFTCMPGTVVSAITSRLKEDLDNIPILNMAYDGLEEAGRHTRLEAFIYQAKQYKENLDKKKEKVSA